MNANDTDVLRSCPQPKLCQQSRIQWTREQCATPLFGGGSNFADVGDMGNVANVGAKKNLTKVQTLLGSQRQSCHFHFFM